MSSEGDPLRSCVAQLARLPGIGERTATRLVYWLLRQPPEVSQQIGEAIQGLPTQVAIEIARRMTPSGFAPSFQQLETALEEANNELNAQPA